MHCSSFNAISLVSHISMITVYDMTGRTVGQVNEATGATEEYQLGLLASGHYILRVTDSEGQVKANLPVSKL